MQGNQHLTSSETEEQQIPFQTWLNEEVKAVITGLMKRGNLPPQAVYILTVALGAILQENATGQPVEERLKLPLELIGHLARPQAKQQWEATQVVN